MQAPIEVSRRGVGEVFSLDILSHRMSVMGMFQQLGGPDILAPKNNQNQTYPIVKSRALRKTGEYLAGVLLIATIVLGLTASEAATMVSLGIFLMVAAFAVSGIRGGLAFRSPYLPMRKAGRIAMFSIGVLSLVLGAIRVLHP